MAHFLSPEMRIHKYVLFYLKVTEEQREICSVYGTSAIHLHTCQRWFVCFHPDDKNNNDTLCTCRPTVTTDEEILFAITSNCHMSTRDIVKFFRINHCIVTKRLI